MCQKREDCSILIVNKEKDCLCFHCNHIHEAEWIEELKSEFEKKYYLELESASNIYENTT